MIRRILRTTLVLAGLVAVASLLPTSAAAQQRLGTPVAASAAAPSVDGPRFERAGISSELATSSSSDTPMPQQDHMGNGSNVAMMIVGGAALIVGLSVGGDGGQIIAVGGAVIGLIGLFRYIR
jgi:hypothetical protein